MIDDSSKMDQTSDEELLSRVRINSPGNASREAAKTELEFRHTKQLIESNKRLAEFAENTEKSTKSIAAFAESTEKSGSRMEVATWVILFATLVQLGLFLHEHYRSAASRGDDTKQATRPQVASPDKSEHVKADTQTWETAEVAVTCSGKEHLLPWLSVDGKGKQVTLNCMIRNLTDMTVPLALPDKVDALFRLPDGRVVRGRAYLGSSQHEIPARGEIGAGLFPGDKDCPAKQSDYDCLQAELMKADELLLTDTAKGVRYHVRIE